MIHLWIMLGAVRPRGRRTRASGRQHLQIDPATAVRGGTGAAGRSAVVDDIKAAEEAIARAPYHPEPKTSYKLLSPPESSENRSLCI